MGQTRLQLCGRLAVTWDGRRIEDALPARQGRLLFVHLVMHRNRPATRDGLVDAVWGEHAPVTADASLRALLSRLRRVLGRDAIAGGDQPMLRLPDGVFVDFEAAREGLHRAQAAVAAREWARAWAPSRIALHTSSRGFLPGHDARWARELRDELDGIRLHALECVGAAGLGLGGGELDAAERSGRRLVELAPFRESGHRLLIESLAARGEVAEALLAYEQVRTRLRDELGVTPGRGLQEAHARLLTGSPPPPAAPG